MGCATQKSPKFSLQPKALEWQQCSQWEQGCFLLLLCPIPSFREGLGRTCGETEFKLYPRDTQAPRTFLFALYTGSCQTVAYLCIQQQNSTGVKAASGIITIKKKSELQLNYSSGPFAAQELFALQRLAAKIHLVLSSTT